jgi:hypothetical protein
MLRFKRSDSLDDNIGAMSQELPHVTTIEITTAVRDAHLGDTVVQAGQVMALVDGDIAAVNADFEEVITTVFSKIDMEEYENLTIYYGQDVPTARARTLCNQLQERFPDHHIEVQCGGQPVYSYILAAE